MRTDLYQAPKSAEAAGDDYLRTMLGSHIMIEGILRARGTPLAPLPFPAAIYRVGHSGAHSASGGLMTRLIHRRHPERILNLHQLRLRSRSIKRNYFGLTRS